MALEPAITDIEVLKDNPALSVLLSWRPDAVKAAKWDRNELALVLERESLREACALLRDNPQSKFDFLADITCVDWYPSEPRFEVVYNFLSISRKERVRIKVLLDGSDPNVESLTSLWPGANYFEREVFDLFGVRFNGHPNLRRILMPDDWEGHPLRKDYPVEGYR
jgi:NADH-quinone oxidoreductase subunit C